MASTDSQMMLDLSFTSCISNMEVWVLKAVNPHGFKYFYYFLIRTYNMLSFSHDHRAIMRVVAKVYYIKVILRLRIIIMSQGGTLMKNCNVDLPNGSGTAWFI